jgi:hypothetical protein
LEGPKFAEKYDAQRSNFVGELEQIVFAGSITCTASAGADENEIHFFVSPVVSAGAVKMRKFLITSEERKNI